MTCVVCGRTVLVLDTRALDSGECVNCQIRLDTEAEREAEQLDERSDYPSIAEGKIRRAFDTD